MERDILVEVNHPFIVKLHYGKRTLTSALQNTRLLVELITPLLACCEEANCLNPWESFQPNMSWLSSLFFLNLGNLMVGLLLVDSFAAVLQYLSGELSVSSDKLYLCQKCFTQTCR